MTRKITKNANEKMLFFANDKQYMVWYFLEYEEENYKLQAT